MRPPATRPPTCGVVRLLTLLLLGIALLTGAAVTAGPGPAWADPTPAPAPAPGVPDPGVPPSPDPGPVPSPSKPTPSPVGPPASTTPAPTPGTPAPAPGPTPPGGLPSDSGDDGPGLFDIPGQIRKAIDDLIVWFAKTALTPILDTLGHTVLSTPDLTTNPQVTTFWATSLVTANGIFVLFVIVGGFIIASRDTLQSRYGLKQIAPRVVVASVGANVSLLVCGKAIELVNAVTAAITGQGVDGQTATTAIEQIVDQQLTNAAPPLVFTLLELAVEVMAIVVVMTFILRVALLVILLGIAPLALMCHATPQTEGLAYAWWRAFGACLGMQVGQAVIILATVRVFLTPVGSQIFGVPTSRNGLLGILVCLSMLWLLIKLPGWMKNVVLGPLGQGRGLVGQIIHAVLMIKTLSALAGAGGRAGRSARPRRPAVPGRPATRSSPSPGPSPYRPTPATARPRPGTVPPRPARPRPAPAGPAAFSHAPATHTPMPPPAAHATGPMFSSPAQPGTPRPASAAPPAPPRFSHQPTPTPATPATGSRPAATPFSHGPTPTTPTRSSGPVPTATFSGAPRPQAAPKRPPAPITPMFSSPAASRPRPAGRTSSPSVAPSPPRPAPPPSPSPAVPPSPSRRSRDGRPREGRPEQRGQR